MKEENLIYIWSLEVTYSDSPLSVTRGFFPSGEKELNEEVKETG